MLEEQLVEQHYTEIKLLPIQNPNKFKRLLGYFVGLLQNICLVIPW